jgi:hypothetical protein
MRGRGLKPRLIDREGHETAKWSGILRDHSGEIAMREELRQRIQEACERLGMRWNASAYGSGMEGEREASGDG